MHHFINLYEKNPQRVKVIRNVPSILLSKWHLIARKKICSSFAQILKLIKEIKWKKHDFLMIYTISLEKISYINYLIFIKMVRQWLLLMLPILAISACSSQCYTCANPNSQLEQNLCLSCKTDYFLFNQTCLSCSICSDYSSCGGCITVGDNDGDEDDHHQGDDQRDEGDGSGSKSILIIIFASLGGVAALVIAFCLIRRCCRPKNLAKNDQIIEMRQQNIQSNQIVSQKEQNNRYESSKYWINSREAIKLQNCSICLDSSAPGIIAKLKCGHIYHLNCITNWSKKDQNCPECRAKDIEPIQSFCKYCNKYYAQIKIKQAKNLLAKPKNSICNSCAL